MFNFDINAYGNTVVYGPSEMKENAALRQLVVQTCASQDLPSHRTRSRGAPRRTSPSCLGAGEVQPFH